MPEKTITIAAELTDEQAWQVAQFAKRSTFDTFYQFTEAHLPQEERKRLAYLMVSGLEVIQTALANAGYAPR